MGVIDPALYWLIIGVMLFFLELMLPGFILFFFGMGALVTALAAWLLHIAVSWQLALFIVSSLASLFALRGIIQRKFFDSGSEEEEEDRDVVLAEPGSKGVVSMGIYPPAEGRIKYAGTFWRATADENIGDGEIISIVHQDGLVIHVEKV
jgi:membrane protein implicated in regulation of membrane protease activity